MKRPADAWCMVIDITNKCHVGSCIYCSRYQKHYRTDQLFDMPPELFKQVLLALRDYPRQIGLIGGEPTLHRQFEELCEIARSMFSKKQLVLFTSGGKKYDQHRSLINDTFGYVPYNPHTEAQKAVCKHQRLTVAIGEAVPHTEYRKSLIEDCWVARTWCAGVNYSNRTGKVCGYGCEIAGAQDLLLDGDAGFDATDPGWWRKTPEEYQAQIDHCCQRCGMAIPMERDLLCLTKEKFSPGFLATCMEHGLRNLDPEHVEVFDKQFSVLECEQYKEKWYPNNYREDMVSDEKSPCGKGATK